MGVTCVPRVLTCARREAGVALDEAIADSPPVTAMLRHRASGSVTAFSCREAGPHAAIEEGESTRQDFGLRKYDYASIKTSASAESDDFSALRSSMSLDTTVSNDNMKTDLPRTLAKLCPSTTKTVSPATAFVLGAAHAFIPALGVGSLFALAKIRRSRSTSPPRGQPVTPAIWFKGKLGRFAVDARISKRKTSRWRLCKGLIDAGVMIR